MSVKIGRNAPCPCGSGKKYKRCCLATDESAARGRAQQPAWFDDEMSDIDFEGGEEGEFFDVEDGESWLDVADIVRVCYTRGLVRKLSDLRSGRGVQVTEWAAPDIPPSVLESIDQEAVDVLEGEWGDPKAGDPMQVDVIDLETDVEVVTIQVFNRAIFLLHADSEEMRRIHRLCGVLERAAGGAVTATENDASIVPTSAPPDVLEGQ